jgi:hypothetical protein
MTFLTELRVLFINERSVTRGLISYSGQDGIGYVRSLMTHGNYDVGQFIACCVIELLVLILYKTKVYKPAVPSLLCDPKAANGM